VLALHAAREGTHLICNLGNGGGFSVREVVDTVKAVTNRDVPMREAARRAGDPAQLVASHDVASTELGWTPSADLTRIVSDAWDFHLSIKKMADS
jgi:UDP-glucose 4-epimerase